MITKEEMELCFAEYEKNKPFFAHNRNLLDIYEGNLEEYILKDLSNSLSPEAYKTMKDRVAPINILNKIVDKTSTVYSQAPNRKVVGESSSEQDMELLSWYEEQMSVNSAMQTGTELYNLSKSHLLQPYVHNGVPSLRAIPNTNFFILALDRVDPMRPTHVVCFKEIDHNKVLFFCYTDMDYTIFNQDLEIQYGMMAAVQNENGINPYGKIPFVYVNQAKFRSMPKPDTDVLTMTKLIPVLMSDLNYAVKFQCFTLLYTINAKDGGIVFAPNAVISIKGENDESKPEVGMIKPQVDINQVLGLIETQLSLWLNSKGIRPGAIGALTKDNFANGISKIIDEMDTVDYKRKLADQYSRVEKELWNLVMHHMHPVWAYNGDIDTAELFSMDAKVQTNFNLQLPAQSRIDLVNEVKTELDAGLISKRTALKRLNPTMSDDEITKMMDEMDEERVLRATPVQQALPPAKEEEQEDQEEVA
jgi:hypothetical protein